MSLMMLALIARARQQPMKTLKQWWKWFWDNRWITITEVADDVDISFGLCQVIFTKIFGMKRTATKIVPKLLNFEHKQHRIDIAQQMLLTFNDDPNLLKQLITDDESWKRPEEPRPKKARQVRPNGKVFSLFSLIARCVVHHEFLPQGRKVNKEYYLEVMCRLRENCGKPTHGFCTIIKH